MPATYHVSFNASADRSASPPSVASIARLTTARSRPELGIARKKNMSAHTDDTTDAEFETVEYDDVDELLATWRSNFERLMDGRWPDDEVTLEWETTDDEAVLRLEEPPEDVVRLDRPGGGPSRSINVYFDQGINAAHESHRFISTQENPMGSGDRKHSAMLAIPLADNRNRRME